MRPRLVATHLAILLMIGANLSGITIYAIYGNVDVGTIVGGITAIAGASVAMIAIVTPKLAEAIRVLGPALAELQKQREEIAKGSLSGKVESLQADLKAMAARVEDANQKLHDARNAAHVQELKHVDEVKRMKEMLVVLTEELKAARGEIESLRAENGDLLRRTFRKVVENTSEIGAIRSTQMGTSPP